MARVLAALERLEVLSNDAPELASRFDVSVDEVFIQAKHAAFEIDDAHRVADMVRDTRGYTLVASGHSLHPKKYGVMVAGSIVKVAVALRNDLLGDFNEGWRDFAELSEARARKQFPDIIKWFRTIP